MGKVHVAAAAALLSLVTTTTAFAQFSEPSLFQAQHPDRDVLNGGVLTPEARAAAGLSDQRSAYGAWSRSTPPAAFGTGAPVRAPAHTRLRHRPM